MTHRLSRSVAVLVVLVGLLAAAPQHAWSHAADALPPAPGSIVLNPRTEARIGQYEVVAIVSKQIFAVFLSRYEDGAPVSNAKLQASTDLQSADLTETDPGVYSTKELLMAPGSNDLSVKLQVGSVTATQALTLTMPTEPEEPAIAKPLITTAGPLTIAGAVLAVYGLLSTAFLVARRRSTSRRPARAALARVWRT